jgi:WD40 repeat protein
MVLLTGHKDGKLVLWSSLMPVKVLKEYRSEIVEIVLVKEAIVVGTEDGTLHFWLYSLDKCIKSIDIKSLPYQLLSSSLKNIVMAGSSIYVNTYGGDFLRIKIKVTEETPGDFKLKFKEKKIKNLVLFDDTWKTMAVLEKVSMV